MTTKKSSTKRDSDWFDPNKGGQVVTAGKTSRSGVKPKS